jgi:proton-coupled amino acid transporter
MSEQHLLDSSGNTQTDYLSYLSHIVSLSSSTTRSKTHIFETEGLRASDLSAPGELRRHYLHSRAEELGIPEEERPQSWNTPFLASIGRLSFIEYLEVGNKPIHEYSKRNGVVMTYFTLLKSMIGTGILFIPRGFYLGGWLMSTLMFCIMSVICTICMLWLSEARSRFHDNFGGLAERAIGPVGKHIVDISVFLTQIGFSIVGVVFFNSNLLKVLEYFGYYGEWWLPVAIQFMIYIPLCLKKHLSELAITHIIGDFIILSNVAYLGYMAFCELEDPAPDIDYITFNSDTFMLMFGMAVYCYEGIGLILPIKEAMKEPEKFDRVLIAMMITVTFLLISFGLLNYLAYGQYIAQMVTLNIETSLTSAFSTLSYLLAIILTYPLMLFAPFEIIEYKLGRDKARRYSDFLRIVIVSFTLAVAVILKQKADKYIALLGALLCSPLAYIMPSIIRIKLKPKVSSIDTIFGFSFIALGVIGSIVTLIITIESW